MRRKQGSPTDDPLKIAERIDEMDKELGIGVPEKVFERIQAACQSVYVEQMASATDVELTGESLVRLSEEMRDGSPAPWMYPPSFGLRITELVNQTTGGMMHLWLASEDRLRIKRPTSTAWADRSHRVRRPAIKATWTGEWVPIP